MVAPHPDGFLFRVGDVVRIRDDPDMQGGWPRLVGNMARVTGLNTHTTYGWVEQSVIVEWMENHIRATIPCSWQHRAFELVPGPW